MKIVYKYNSINKLKSLSKGDKIRIVDGSGGDTGNVFFINYLDNNKVIFVYQFGYLTFIKYLLAHTDYKTLQIYKA